MTHRPRSEHQKLQRFLCAPARRAFFLAAILGALPAAGFGAEQNSERANSSAKEKSALFIVATNANLSGEAQDIVPLKSVPNLTGHRAVLKLRNGLTEGQVYRGQFSLRDPDGKEVPLPEEGKFEFTAEGSGENCWTVYNPPYERQKPGKWTWSAAVETVGRFSQEIAVQPLTPQETPGLQRYEQAGKAVRLAVAHFWYGKPPLQPGEPGVENSKDVDYFTAIVTEDQGAKAEAKEAEEELSKLKIKSKRLASEDEVKTAEVEALSRVVGIAKENARIELQKRFPEWDLLSKSLGAGALYYGRPIPRDLGTIRQEIANLPGEERRLKERMRPVTNTYYVQIRGLRPLPASVPFLTEADRLNGITYRGIHTFGFRVYRFYHPESGWSDWQDAAYVPENLAALFAQTLGQFTAQRFPNLSFSLLQRNGQWRITTSGGDVFVDGQKIDRPESERPSVAGFFLPRASAIIEFLKTGRTTRDDDRELAEWIKKNPKELEDQVKDTIELLGGKPRE